MNKTKIKVCKVVYDYDDLKRPKPRKQCKEVSIYYNTKLEMKQEIDRKTELYKKGLL